MILSFTIILSIKLKIDIKSFRIFSLIAIVESFKAEMIPKRPASGCPSGTFNSMRTCFCEDHCSWEICRLITPPHNCLSRIDGEAIWSWDALNDAWVAQGMI